MTDNKIYIKKGDTRSIAFVRAFLPRTQIKFVVGGAVVAVLMAYDGQYGNFAALRFGDVIWGGLGGLAVSLAVDGASSAGRLWAEARERRLKQPGPFRNRPARAPRQNRRTMRNTARTIRMEDGRKLPINTGRDSFDYSPPQGRTITIYGKRDLAKALLGSLLGWSPSPEPGARPTAPPTIKPPEVDEIKFESYDRQGEPIQLLGSDVWRFLSIAWRNNARGSGLSFNRWSGKRYRLPGWYQGKGIGWYWAMLNLMSDAEEVTGTRLARVVWVSRARRVGYLVMTMNNSKTYEMLLYCCMQQRIEEGTDD